MHPKNLNNAWYMVVIIIIIILLLLSLLLLLLLFHASLFGNAGTVGGTSSK